MTVATALAAGNVALPQLAEAAVLEALEKSGLSHASGVLLFLTPEFARNAQAAVTAAARAAQCMQVAGGLAAGVFTEAGWVLDRPAAAAMVFGNGLSLGHADATDAALLSYAGGTVPPEWNDDRARFGGSFSGAGAHAEPAVWQQSRLDPRQRCSVQILGTDARIGVSSGLRLLGAAQRVEASNGYDLERIGGRSALDSLQRALPAGFDAPTNAPAPLHQLTAVLLDAEPAPHGSSSGASALDAPAESSVDDAQAALADGRYRPLAIIAVNADHSLTLAERTVPGQRLAWAIRQAVPAEADMRRTLERLAGAAPAPDCALMFSCIGRGPYFYGGEDRDLDALRERFPGLPLLGTYGTGQIAPAASAAGHRNRQLHNAAVTALITRR